MTELAHRPDGGALAEQLPGARPLGLRVKPIIRLGMGVRDEARGFPIPTDHFTVRGDDTAVAQFYAVYGEKPKAVDILLPSTLDMALRIEYLAFKGGPDGGDLIARGQTNFAHRDYAGGPDLLTVWNKDGSVVHDVETAGLDAITRQPLDQIAEDLGLALHTTLRAGLPAVLDFGSFFEITTKGKESTDNLWVKLRQLYGFFGSSVSFAVKPRLMLRESTMRPVVEKDGESKRIRKQTWVLDIVSPETLDEMFSRLQERGSMLTGHYEPVAALPAAPESGLPVPDVSDADFTPVSDEAAGAGLGAASAATSPAAEPGEQASLLADDEQPPRQSAEQGAALRKVFANTRHYGPPPALEDADGQEIDFSGTENPWVDYATAWIEREFGVSWEQLNGPQTERLIAHLQSLDIPF